MTVRPPATPRKGETAERLLGPEGLTERKTAFSEPELAMAWAQAHRQGASVERIRELCGRLLTIGGVQRLTEPAPGRPALHSTLELLELEQNALELVERGRDADSPVVHSAIVDAAVHELSAEQEAMVRAVASSHDRVVCVVGPAGAGKTTATHAVAAAFQAAGSQVVGAAPSGIAAERLQDETGIPSQTLHRLLAQENHLGGLPEGCVLIVDEAAMAETRVLAPILAAVEQERGKVVLIGDPQQLPAVGAGGLFAAIVERHGAVELRENQRQRDELERRALQAVRDGRGRDYLAFAEQRGRLVVSDDPVANRTRLVGDWWRDARTELAGNVMLAHRRADVAELNMLARRLMNEEGRLGEERLVAAGRELRAGDRILCRRNSDTLGVRNGTRGTVTSVEPERGTLTFESDRGDQVELSAGYLEAGHVEHAYALTGHAAQGLTVERAFVLGADRGRLQEWGYVALSRAREATRLYITDAQAERDNHFQQLDDRDPLTRVSQSLEQPGAERLAHDSRRSPTRPEPRSRPVIVRRSPAKRELENAQARLRTLNAQEQRARDLRDRAQRRIVEVERQLAGLGWRERRQHRHELGRELAFQQRALTAAEQTLTELEPERKRALARVQLGRRMALEQERPPVRETRRERERQPSLDLGL